LWYADYLRERLGGLHFFKHLGNGLTSG
jgi:hypothetical protein